MGNEKKLSPEQRDVLIQILKVRFEKNQNRHTGIEWSKVQARLESTQSIAKLWSLNEMEKTGGEPDIITLNMDSEVLLDGFVFCDCSKESPAGRRSLCYDNEALESRKEHKPKNSAIGMAAAMGVEMLTEEVYRELQNFGNFDTKTSSWLKTPTAIRSLGGAIFGDFRYGQVFVYHNGAESYYAARAFRALLRV